MTNSVFTLDELLGGEYFGLVVTDEGIEQALSYAKRDNDFYIGTNVYEWLSNMDIVRKENLEEYFPLFDEEGDVIGVDFESELVETNADNSYNWGGNGSTDFNVSIFENDTNTFAYIAIHRGGDIRGNYSNGILIDLGQCNSDDAYMYLLDSSYNYTESGQTEIDGTLYSIDGNISSEELSIYNHDTHDDYYGYGGVYAHSLEEFEKECKELVIEVLEREGK